MLSKFTGHPEPYHRNKKGQLFREVNKPRNKILSYFLKNPFKKIEEIVCEDPEVKPLFTAENVDISERLDQLKSSPHPSFFENILQPLYDHAFESLNISKETIGRIQGYETLKFDEEKKVMSARFFDF